MGEYRDYSHLKSMDEVRRERMRIAYEIDLKKKMLENDFERVGRVFSGEYLLRVLADRSSRIVSGIASQFSSYIRNFSSGFNLVNGLFDRLTRRFRPSKRYGRPRNEYYEEEYCYEPEEDEFEESFEEGCGCQQ